MTEGVDCSQEELNAGLSAFDIISVVVGSLERLSMEVRYAD